MNNLLIFRENAADMEEKEVLEYILSLCPNRKNNGELSGVLLDTFGSLKAVLEARPEQLKAIPGIGERSAQLIASFLPVVRIWQRLTITEPQKICNARAAESFCKSLLSGCRCEEFWVICLNAQCKVLGKRRISTGSLSEVSAYPRLVVETALNYNAHSVILSHNHPGGTCAPSMEDIQSTIQLKRLLNGVGIMILDHIIVAGDNTYSMVQHGDIDYRTK